LEPGPPPPLDTGDYTRPPFGDNDGRPPFGEYDRPPFDENGGPPFTAPDEVSPPFSETQPEREYFEGIER